jgi:hypothetical protein
LAFPTAEAPANLTTPADVPLGIAIGAKRTCVAPRAGIVARFVSATRPLISSVTSTLSIAVVPVFVRRAATVARSRAPSLRWTETPATAASVSAVSPAATSTFVMFVPAGMAISSRVAQPCRWKSEMRTTSRRGRFEPARIWDASLSGGP